jgi:hypothetical protein
VTKLPRGQVVISPAAPGEMSSFTPRPAAGWAGELAEDVPAWQRPEYARHRAVGSRIGIAVIHLVAGVIWTWRGLRWSWRRRAAVMTVASAAVDRLKAAKKGREEV